MRTSTSSLAIRRLIDAAKRQPPRRRRPRPPRVPFPGAAERRYRHVLLASVERLRALVNERLIPALPRLAALAQQMRPDPVKLDDTRLDDWVSEAQSILQGILQRMLEDTGDADDIATGIAHDVADANMDGLGRQLKVLFGTDVVQIPQPWLREQMRSFAVENAQLVKSIPEDEIKRLTQIIQKEFRAGTDVRKIAKQIEATFDVSRNKAKLIARDQVGSLNGTLTQLRNQELGSSTYRWLTAGDERVRPTHQERDGEFFRWDDPPPDGNPGQPINCRCVAEPQFDDVLALVG